MNSSAHLAPIRKRVLIADDETIVLQMLVDLLRNEPVDVVTAGNGADAWELLEHGGFDLLISDVWMPHLNGLELLSRLRHLPSAPPVIVMTGDDAPLTMLEAVRKSAHHVFAKPFIAADMVDAVRRALAVPDADPIEVISATPSWVELSLPCELRSPDRIQPLLMKLKSDLPHEVRENVAQAFRELLLNAIEWGGKLDPRHRVRLSYIRTARMLLYRISDPGAGFKFAALEHAAVNNPEGDPIRHMKARDEQGLRPGGLGILMAQQLVDEVIYNELQNEVLLVKYLD